MKRTLNIRSSVARSGIIAGQKRYRDAKIPGIFRILGFVADHVKIHPPHPDVRNLLELVVRIGQVRHLAIHVAHIVQITYQIPDLSFFPTDFPFHVQQAPSVHFELWASGPHAEMSAQLVNVEVDGEEERSGEIPGYVFDVLDQVFVGGAPVKPHDDFIVASSQVEIELMNAVYGDVISHL